MMELFLRTRFFGWSCFSAAFSVSGSSSCVSSSGGAACHHPIVLFPLKPPMPCLSCTCSSIFHLLRSLSLGSQGDQCCSGSPGSCRCTTGTRPCPWIPGGWCYWAA
ncbi:uncharacterized protein LOC109118577 isoform X2 [Fukomys damarensis]|uniref:uncharacterized protein LOC109118577 isoform X2 n=1 Tax=Fukomys damarensis TaxID=885580 RepID=UPI0008FF2C5E|nr:uncharacterized protein LOC109118577 isoform X2 [Fukomys damarensis]